MDSVIPGCCTGNCFTTSSFQRMDVQQMVTTKSQLVQYADDTMIIICHRNIEQVIARFELKIQKLILLFECHRLIINVDKTGSSFFRKH